MRHGPSRSSGALPAFTGSDVVIWRQEKERSTCKSQRLIVYENLKSAERADADRPWPRLHTIWGRANTVLPNEFTDVIGIYAGRQSLRKQLGRNE